MKRSTKPFTHAYATLTIHVTKKVIKWVKKQKQTQTQSKKEFQRYRMKGNLWQGETSIINITTRGSKCFKIMAIEIHIQIETINRIF